MDLVKDDPRYFSYDFRSTIKHRAKNLWGLSGGQRFLDRTRANLRGHDQARRSWVDGYITGHQPNVSKVGKKFSVFLIAERLTQSQ